MRRYLLIVMVCSVIFFSCEKEGLYCTISNNSSHFVSFQFSSVYTNEFTLPPGETEVYDDIGNATLKYFKVDGVLQNEKRLQVEYRISHRDAEFVDFTPITINIYNTLSIPVEFSAGGYMETDPMSVSAAEIDKVDAIYTKTPEFTVTTATYPAVADYEIKNGVMYITIR